MIIKHKLCLSDEETIEQIRENPYLQYFVGFNAFHKEQAFAPSLFVEIRRRMGPGVFAIFEESIIARLTDHQKPEACAADDDNTADDITDDESADHERQGAKEFGPG